MQAKSDAELLREYAAHASEAAFREIVTRHADLVYASALRQARSPELARDIAQTVFADLVRKAPALGQILTENASLVGWLYRSTRFEAHTQLRDDRRRQARERQAMENFDATPETATEWERVGPVLDEAMADLDDEDREALLLRFFKNHDFRTIGLSLGVSDDAAQKRVSRALERLRAEFHRRGVTTTAVALSAAVSANAVSEGPAGLAAALSTAALTGTTLTTAATSTVTKVIAMTTLHKTLITATITIAVGTGIYEARQAAILRTQVQALQEQQSQQIQQLQSERDNATRQVALLREDNQRLSLNSAELLRLRGLVGTLNRQIALATNSQPLTAQKAGSGPAWKLSEPRWPNEFQNVGLQTPQAAAETLLWAAQNEPMQLINMVHLSEDMLQRYRQNPETMMDVVKTIAERVRGYTQSDGNTPHQIWFDGGRLQNGGLVTMTGLKDGSIVTNQYNRFFEFRVASRENMNDAATQRWQDMNLHKINGQWKLIIPVISPDTRFQGPPPDVSY